VLDGTDFERSLLDLPRGKVVDVIVARDGREQTLQLTVGVGKPTGTSVAAISQQSDVQVSGSPEQTAEAPRVARNGNRSRVEQDARSGLAFEAGIDGIAEPLVDGTFLEAAGF